MPKTDISKLLADGTSLGTELTGRMQELATLRSALDLLSRQSSEQLTRLELSLEHGHAISTDFKKLQAEFKKEATTPLETLIKRKTAAQKKYDKFKLAITDLPAEYNFQASSSTIAQLFIEFSSQQAELQVNIDSVLTKFQNFAEMLLLPEAVLKIKQMEKAADRLALNIASLAQKHANLEATPLDLRELLAKLEELPKVGKQLSLATHRLQA